MNPEWTLRKGRQRRRDKGTIRFYPYTGGHAELSLLMDEVYWRQIGEPETVTVQIVRMRSRTGGWTSRSAAEAEAKAS